MKTYLASLVPPTGVMVCQGPLCNRVNAQGVSDVFSIAIQLLFLIAGLITLLFLLMGAIQYLTSGGEKEKTHEAQGKIMYAVIGLFIVIFSWTLWVVIVSDVLGLFGPGGAIKLPSLGQ